MINESELVAIGAGDVLAGTESVHEITRLDVDFHIDGRGGRAAHTGRSGSRTPAHSVEAEVLAIQPDGRAYHEVESLRTYLVVLKALAKGRKCYPLHCALDDLIRTLRWEFARVARRGSATFTLWQDNRQFHDHEYISVIDRTKYLEVWKIGDGEPHAAALLPDQGLQLPRLSNNPQTNRRRNLLWSL